MRIFSILVLAAALAAFMPARASACEAAPASSQALSGWTVDHYVYDAALARDWEVMVDCEHPARPARIRLAPQSEMRAVKKSGGSGMRGSKAEALRRPKAVRVMAGAPVEVTSADARVRILMAGTAMQTAFLGQSVRVRLTIGGRFVEGIVRGPHRIELAAAGPSWGKP